ncbi:MAG: hypothetical protein V7647_995 [Acidobacteriota bacterium]|jgi:hypothetical protein
MDLTTIPVPEFTPLDGITQALAAICYIGIGAAAWLRATADIRTRVFFAFAIANFVVCSVPTVWWLRASANHAKLPMGAVTAMTSAMGVGALLLFHFTQVFPRRRPWIKTSGMQMAVAYCVAPLTIAGLLWFAPSSVDTLSTPYKLALVVFGFPLVVLLGIVLPVTAIVSLARSHRELQQLGHADLKRPLELILLSQIAGGTLAAVFAPVLATVAPNSGIQYLLTLVIWALGLMTPLAFAAAVWKCNVLAMNPE